MLGQFLHKVFVDATAGVEASDQRIAVNKEHSLTLNGLFVDRKGQIDPPIQHHLE